MDHRNKGTPWTEKEKRGRKRQMGKNDWGKGNECTLLPSKKQSFPLLEDN